MRATNQLSVLDATVQAQIFDLLAALQRGRDLAVRFHSHDRLPQTQPGPQDRQKGSGPPPPLLRSTVLNAPGQRDDPGVTVIMGGVGVVIRGVALLVLVLRMLLVQAVARDVEAAQMQSELDEVI